MLSMWKEGEHPSGFVGIRVVGLMPDGSKVQRYFNYRERDRKNGGFKLKSADKIRDLNREAKALNNLVRDHIKRKNAQQPHHRVTACRETGVSRLTLEIAMRKAKASKRKRNKNVLFEYDYGYPCFLARPYCGHNTGKSVRSFLISKLGYHGAWEAAVDYWASGDEFSKKARDQVLMQIPHPKRFVELYWQLRKELRAPPETVLKELKKIVREFKG